MAYCEPIETSLPAGGVTFLQLKQYLESREGEHLAADNDDYEDMDSNDSLGDYNEIFVNVDESRAASDAYFDIDNKNIETQLNNSRSCYESMSNNEFRRLPDIIRPTRHGCCGEASARSATKY
jgi:hypothetical protein